jgi:valyl-tRNA synthetase
VRLIGEVRTVRAEMNVPPSTLGPLLLKDAAPETLARGARWMEAIGRLARVSQLGPLDGDVPPASAVAVLDEATIVLPLSGLIDFAAERARLEKELAKARKEIEAVSRKLDNADFVARAKPEVVEENRERLDSARQDVARLQAALARIG